MYVVVIGGGNVGYYLTKELLAAGHEVVVIEEDPARARQIADELGSIVIANDGCEGRYQAEAGMGRADGSPIDVDDTSFYRPIDGPAAVFRSRRYI